MAIRRKKKIPASQRDLFRERFQTDRYYEPLKGEPEKLGDLLDDQLSKIGMQDQWLIELKENWPELVGEDVAKFSSPTKYDYGILYVSVPNRTWLFQLQSLGTTVILDNIKKRYPARKIRQVRLRADA